MDLVETRPGGGCSGADLYLHGFCGVREAAELLASTYCGVARPADLAADVELGNLDVGHKFLGEEVAQLLDGELST